MSTERLKTPDGEPDAQVTPEQARTRRSIACMSVAMTVILVLGLVYFKWGWHGIGTIVEAVLTFASW